jgi:hypothetical protein
MISLILCEDEFSLNAPKVRRVVALPIHQNSNLRFNTLLVSH